MKKNKKLKKISIEKIESIALEGKDVGQFFSEGKMVHPLDSSTQKINIDFKKEVLKDLDIITSEIKVRFLNLEN